MLPTIIAHRERFAGCHRGNEIMNRLFVASACALFLVACSKPEPTAPNNPTPGAAATVSQVKLELGKTV